MTSLLFGGAGGDRTLYLFNAIEALSQVSYSPTIGIYHSKGRIGAASPCAICSLPKPAASGGGT